MKSDVFCDDMFVCCCQELVVALGGLVMHSAVQFAAVAFKFLEDEKQQKTLAVPPVGLNIAIGAGRFCTS